jgi:hypothetical protein
LTRDHGPTCDCCAGLTDRTPVELGNRPGLSAIAYRTGAYGSFRASMLAGLSHALRPQLASLRTREPDDFSIALIDAWAVAADVLTFYTERIANEHYLGTATERRSVAEMAALIGYRLKPGVAAQAWLAFTLETAPGAPPESTISRGSRVQTLPGPGELPQTFETVEDLSAVAAWNRPQLQATEPRVPKADDTSVLLAGAAVGVQRGDLLLFVADDRSSDPDRWATARVTAVNVDAGEQQTLVTFAPALPAELELRTGVGVAVHALRGQAALFGFNAPNPRLFAEEVRGALATELADPDPTDPDDTDLDWIFDPVVDQELFLDGLYEGLQPLSWSVVVNGSRAELARVTSVRETAKSAYAVSARVSVVELDLTDTELAAFGGTGTRSTLVRFRSEELALAEVASTAPLHGVNVPLARALPPNPTPRRILVRGKRPRAAVVGRLGFGLLPPWPAGETPMVTAVDDQLEGLPGQVRWTLLRDDGETFTATGPPAAVVYLPARGTDATIGEVAEVGAVAGPDPVASLVLTRSLANVYDRRGATPIELFGNVADATHGETVTGEVLGSGDGARPFQRFALRRAPLTHVPAPTPTGGASTLEVRVNGLRWQEAATLFAAGRRDRVYVTAIDDEGRTTVLFGDGEAGARLPTGSENVVAAYRAGLGLAGSARADQITLALTRPLGLRSVTNPLPAGGAQDAQAAEDARTNAPRSVLTLGRVVSLTDYTDFAADFSGVGKAAATWTWDGARRGVLLTVAAADGRSIPPAAPLLGDLRISLAAAGSARVPLELRDFRPAHFGVRATVRVHPDHEADVVSAAVAAALLTRFSFASRAFGEGVSLSEVAEAVHAVAGVEGVRIDRFHRDDEPVAVASFLVADAPRPGGPPGAPGAEILTLAEAGLTVEAGW